MRFAALLLLLVAGAARAQPSEDVLGCPPRQDDDQKTRERRAAEHYARGEELYAQGEYERSIPEFQVTYCLVPVPEALFAIGQSYERLVEYEKAVKWFELYLRVESPEKKEQVDRVGNRVRVLKRLPARIRVGTEPAGAALLLDGAPDGKPVRGVANRDTLRVLAGHYTLHVSLDGYQPVTEILDVEIGQPYTFSYRLQPKTGTLRVSTEPGEARIALDGKLAGIGALVERVPVGSHIVTVEAPGRPSETRRLQIEADTTISLGVRMKPARPPNGRRELLITSGAYSTIEGGVAGTLVADSPVGGVAGAIGWGAAGVVVPYLVLPDQVPVGEASLFTGGRFWGAVEGAALGRLIEASDRVFDTVLVVGSSIAFSAGGYLAGRQLHISSGDAALVNSGALWGSAAGALLYLAFDEERLAGPFLLGGVNIGLLTGAALGTRYEFSRGRVALIDASGFAGTVAGTALAVVANQAEERVSTARFSLGGMVIGLIVGSILTSYLGVDSGVPGAVTPAVSLLRDAGGRTVRAFGASLTW